MIPITFQVGDLYCGAGGASAGVHLAAERLGASVELIAVNHWNIAIETHSANFPNAKHLLTDVERVAPRDAVPTGKLDLLIAAPSCVHHSKARGGRPTSDQQRSSGWDVIRWLRDLDVSNLLVENVPEFVSWGPVDETTGKPKPEHKGLYFRQWLRMVRDLGYNVEYRVLCSANFGDATTRKRLFIQARKGNRPIVWPVPTHHRADDTASFPGTKTWVPARDIIDWSIKGEFIFTRKRPLVPATMKRIMAGLKKFCGVSFVIGQQSCAAPRSTDEPLPTVATSGAISLCEPFIVVFRRSGSTGGQQRPRSLDEPLPTVCAGGEHIALAEPFIVPNFASQGARSVDSPLNTVTTNNRGVGLCEPFLISIAHKNGGGSDYAYSADAPLKTVTAKAEQCLCEPFLVGVGAPTGQQKPRSVDEPLGTLLAENNTGVCEPFLVRYHGGKDFDKRCESVDEPLTTVDTSNRFGLAEPFLVSYHGNDEAHGLDVPLRTIETKDRFALVSPEHGAFRATADGDTYYRLDVRFRMLTPEELARAHSFAPEYHFAGGRADRVKQVGNSITVNLFAALSSAILESEMRA